MVIKLEDYRKKKSAAIEGKVKIPIYEKIYMKEGKLIGQFSTGRTEIIDDYSNKKE